jgi:hypothetical protein
MYAYLWKIHALNAETNESKTAKGIVKSVIKNELRFEHFKKCLFENVDTFRSMNVIRCQNHVLHTDLIVNKGLPSYDDKRYWLNGIYSLSFGHYTIKDCKYCILYYLIKLLICNFSFINYFNNEKRIFLQFYKQK